MGTDFDLNRASKIGQIVFSRCLENGKWPDRIEFTKYLYLLDWSHYRLRGVTLTGIRWKFFHYGPWSEDVIPIMASVQNDFQLGWVDYSTEERDVPEIDPATDSLGATAEGLLKRIITAFSKRDASAVVDFCYRLTEPMAQAKRGEYLDFGTISVTGEAPVFFPAPQTIGMPRLSPTQMEGKKRLRETVKARRQKYEKWCTALEGAEYVAAMSVLRREQESDLSEVPKNIHGYLSTDALDQLEKLKDE